MVEHIFLNLRFHETFHSIFVNDIGRFLKSFQYGFNNVMSQTSNGKGFGGKGLQLIYLCKWKFTVSFAVISIEVFSFAVRKSVESTN